MCFETKGNKPCFLGSPHLGRSICKRGIIHKHSGPCMEPIKRKLKHNKPFATVFVGVCCFNEPPAKSNMVRHWYGCLPNNWGPRLVRSLFPLNSKRGQPWATELCSRIVWTSTLVSSSVCWHSASLCPSLMTHLLNLLFRGGER